MKAVKEIVTAMITQYSTPLIDVTGAEDASEAWSDCNVCIYILLLLANLSSLGFYGSRIVNHFKFAVRLQSWECVAYPGMRW